MRTLLDGYQRQDHVLRRLLEELQRVVAVLGRSQRQLGVHGVARLRAVEVAGVDGVVRRVRLAPGGLQVGRPELGDRLPVGVVAVLPAGAPVRRDQRRLRVGLEHPP